MFQLSATKFFLLLIVAASFGAFWYLDTNYYHWDRYLPEPDEMVVDTVEKVTEEPQKNLTFSSKKFVPTNDWQTIEKDQEIPPGLHVTIDLQSGEKKAKLIDNNINAKANSLAITSSNNSHDINNESKEQLRKKHKFKSYAALKDDLNEMNMSIKSDVEIMDELSVQFQQQLKIYENSDNNLQNILSDLEYLLHQIDTAEVFVKNKGIQSIIIPCLNSNSSYMKAQGALLIGSAASNNQKVQIAALVADVIPFLLKYISDEYEFSVQKNCLFALSSITRRFPRAQQQVINENGIQTYLSIFKRPKSDLNTKLQLKVTQLLEDLVIEFEDAKLTVSEETNERLSLEAKERVRQYDELDFKNKLVENGWCETLSTEFIRLSNSLPTNEEGHTLVEASGKCLLAMDKLCLSRLQANERLYKSLYALEAYYKNLSHDDDYFNPLYQIMNVLTNSYDPVLE